MAWTVNSAFEEFRKNYVDLDSALTHKARSSRDYLFKQIRSLSLKTSDFPALCRSEPKFIQFGSFARKTKINPLDDIDFLVLLDASNCRFEPDRSLTYTYDLVVTRLNPLEIPPLWRFTNEDRCIVNSTKVLNGIKRGLFQVENYKKADNSKKKEVVSLDLLSYPWNFDIVPAIEIQREQSSTCFLIPNGYGQWIPADPRIDRERTTAINQQHNSNFLPILRLLKYWNSIATNRRAKLPSYYFENLAIEVFRSKSPPIASYQDGISYFFDHCPHYLNQAFPDPKGLNGNLDASIDHWTKYKITESMRNCYKITCQADFYESVGNHQLAIDSWKQIFGWSFPSYG